MCFFTIKVLREKKNLKIYTKNFFNSVIIRCCVKNILLRLNRQVFQEITFFFFISFIYSTLIIFEDTFIKSLKITTKLERNCRPQAKNFRCSSNKNQNPTSKILLKVWWKRLDRIISVSLQSPEFISLVANPSLPHPTPLPVNAK